MQGVIPTWSNSPHLSWGGDRAQVLAGVHALNVLQALLLPVSVVLTQASGSSCRKVEGFWKLLAVHKEAGGAAPAAVAWGFLRAISSAERLLQQCSHFPVGYTRLLLGCAAAACLWGCCFRSLLTCPQCGEFGPEEILYYNLFLFFFLVVIILKSLYLYSSFASKATSLSVSSLTDTRSQ